MRNSRLLRFKDCHLGQRLVLMCNGPSLGMVDFSLLRGEIVMGLNKIYLGLERFRVNLRYYVAINDLVIEQSASEIQSLNCIKFIKAGSTARGIKESALTYLILSRSEERFHEDLCHGFCQGYTVTFAALQIAYFMGFSSVVIVGMDHRYYFDGLPNERCELAGEDPNHFDPRYFSGKTWNNPDLVNSERFYTMAREAFESRGRYIVDCTVNGACNVFQKGCIEEVFR